MTNFAWPLPKTLPVPEALDRKIWIAASRFSARRRMRRRWIYAAAALLLVSAAWLPIHQRAVRRENRAMADWISLDQECFNLSSEMNVCFPNDEEVFL